MNTTELDEWQGITADMVREWLKRTGWELRTDEWGEKRWFNGNGRSIADKRVLVKDGFRWIASQSVQTVQALLCEINPRMRKGMPSGAAIAAHEASGGNWLSQSAQNGGVLRVLNWSVSDHRATLNTLDTTQKIPRDMVPDSWCFWPCDEHGNKVRWPERNGVML